MSWAIHAPYGCSSGEKSKLMACRVALNDVGQLIDGVRHGIILAPKDLYRSETKTLVISDVILEQKIPGGRSGVSFLIFLAAWFAT
jgi:hypothetical protein